MRTKEPLLQQRTELKVICIVLACLIGAIPAFAQQCDPSVFVESVAAQVSGSKAGYIEFRHDDLPKIRYYLQRVMQRSTSFESESTVVTPGTVVVNQGGDFWTDSMAVRIDSSVYQASKTSRKGECNDIEVNQDFTGNQTISSYENITGTLTAFGNLTPSIQAQASEETTSSVETMTLTAVDGPNGKRGKWDWTRNLTYTITWIGETPDPEEFGLSGYWQTYAEWYVDDLDELDVPPGVATVDSPTSMTVTDASLPAGETDTMTVTLSNENTTEDFVDCLRKGLPPYNESGGWSLGSDTALVALNAEENATAVGQPAKRFKYRYRLRGTESEQQYRVRWRESRRRGGEVGTRNLEALVSGNGLESVSPEFEVDLPANEGEVRIFGARAEVEASCSSCGESRGISPLELTRIPGVGTVENHGVYVRIGLGNGKFGESAGEILISSMEPSEKLRKAHCLQVTSSRPDVLVVRDPEQDAKIVSIMTPQARVTVANETDISFELHFRHPNDPNGAPFKTWKFQGDGVENTPITSYQITETEVGSGAPPKVYVYQYLAGTTRLWQLGYPGNLRTDAFATTSAVSGNNIDTIETLTVRNGAGLIVHQVSQHYRVEGTDQPAWREVLVSETVGFGSDAKTTISDYHEGVFGDGNMASPVKKVTHPDGSWEWFATYGSFASGSVPATTYSPNENEGMDELDATKHRLTYRSYDPIDGEDHWTYEPWQPRLTMVYVPDPRNPGQTLWSSGKGIVIEPGLRKERVLLDEGGSQFLETIYRFNTAQTLLSVKYPDGTLFTQGFEPQETYKVWRTRKGKPNPAGTAVVDGTETETRRGLLGYPIYKLTRDIASGIVTSREDYDNPDAYGRPQRITYLDGSTATFTYDCCGTATMVDRDKVTVTTATDALRRMTAQTRLNVTTSYTLDPLGRTLKTQRISGTQTQTPQTLGEVSYDTAGEVKIEKNAFGGETEHEEENESGTGRYVKRAINHATGAIREEIYNRSGTLAEVKGIGTSPVRYLYGIETDDAIPGHGDVYLKNYSCEVRLRGGGETNEWVKTYFDAAGQPFKKLFAYDVGQPIPAHRYFYNSKGQLEKEVDPDGVTRLYGYSERGEMEYTAVDLPVTGVKNGQMDLTGVDRVQRVQKVYGFRDSTPVYREDTSAWFTANSGTPTLVQRVERSVNGLLEWHTIYNGGSVVLTRVERTISNADGGRTARKIYPDNSYLEEAYQHGRLVSSTRRMPNNAILRSATFGYDIFGRQNSVIDARNGTTTHVLNAADVVTSATTPVPGAGLSAQTTSYSYDAAGRLTGVTEPDQTTKTLTYYPNDLLKKSEGSRTYSVEYTYDAQGRVETMKTWQNAGTTAVTAWVYDAYSGLLKTKTYAGSAGPLYLYTPGGRLRERQWVRTINGQRVKTTYAYNDAGEISGVTHSDGTLPVGHAYDRAGRLKTVTQDGTVTMNYRDIGLLESEVYASGTLGNRTVTHGYNHDLLLRVSLQMNTHAETLLNYGYDTASRLESIAAGVYTAGYTYQANSALLNATTSKQSGTTRLVVGRQYDFLNRLQQISGAPGTPNQQPWQFAYAYNDANQRTETSLSDGSKWSYDYDDLGQVTEGKRSWSDQTPVAGQQFEYAFDSIGNRTLAKRGGNPSGGDLRSSSYTPNLKNQYDQRTVPGFVEVQGIAIAGTTVNVNDSSAGVERKGEYFRKELSVSNGSSPQYPLVTVQVTDGSTVGAPEIGNLFFPKNPEIFVHDEDGNLKSDGRWIYQWDAENRLIQMQSLNPPAGSNRKLEFKYDWRGRRIYKKETNLDTGSVTERKFVYDGWNLYAELDGSGVLIRTYIWGLDLSGALPDGPQGAGGVGGLVGVKPAGGPVHFVAYDGNGNVAGLVNGADGLISAWYEYGPFGEPLRVSGTLADANPIRFSSKYTDDTSQFVYYGYRYYNPGTGRWLNRDPIGEQGGLGLYGFLGNSPTTTIDPLGWSDFNRPPAIAFPNSPAIYGPPNPEPVSNPGMSFSSRLLLKRKLWEETTCCQNAFTLTVAYTISDIGIGLVSSFDDPAGAIMGQLQDWRQFASGIGSGTGMGAIDDLRRASSLILVVLPLKGICCAKGSAGANAGEIAAARAAADAIAESSKRAGPLPAGELPYQLKLFPDEAYNRVKHYGRTPTAEQRASVPPGMEFDHNPSLVQHYYEGLGDGGLPGFNLTRSERFDHACSLSSGRPSTAAQQRFQGAAAAAYSKRQKKQRGLD